MILIREAKPQDAYAIREIFLASYGTDYSPRFYDESYLTKLLQCGDNLVLMAESSETGEHLGTAAVDFQREHASTLVGHFGRMAVHPQTRRCGAGNLLMKEVISRVGERIQVGLAEARAVEAHASRIAENHGFTPVGFLPLKLRLREPESFVLLVRHFGNTLALRDTCPRVTRDVYPLAQMALGNCGLGADGLRLEDAALWTPTCPLRNFTMQRLSAEEGIAIFAGSSESLCCAKDLGAQTSTSPWSKSMETRSGARADTADQGKSSVSANEPVYLAAREEGRFAGAIEFRINPHHRIVSVFKLIALDWAADQVIGFLLSQAEREWTEQLGAAARVVEINVSAEEPRIQRMLGQLGFVAVAYVPALALIGKRRVDVVTMFRVAAPVEICADDLTPKSKAVAELVLSGLRASGRESSYRRQWVYQSVY